MTATGNWVVAETLSAARAAAGKVQGRRTTIAGCASARDAAPGDWDLTLRTTWVEPAYLEPDASWCCPGGEPVTALANGGAFGGKRSSEVGAVARRLADEHGKPGARPVVARRRRASRPEAAADRCRASIATAPA